MANYSKIFYFFGLLSLFNCESSHKSNEVKSEGQNVPDTLKTYHCDQGGEIEFIVNSLDDSIFTYLEIQSDGKIIMLFDHNVARLGSEIISQVSEVNYDGFSLLFVADTNCYITYYHDNLTSVSDELMFSISPATCSVLYNEPP
ncbi:MAG: hypothetical protein ABR574_02895 [Cryomorphaceae bacterium]|nr:hypothetical protein [Flavobacteriales bacterium]